MKNNHFQIIKDPVVPIPFYHRLLLLLHNVIIKTLNKSESTSLNLVYKHLYYQKFPKL